ncbi:hydroxyethylthiazole kinase [Desulfopila aestuarii]|uniref:Hydroxyethylthiazole kinase n=1 Tax=Desulfopila aestuarii DSM 18488 TaxID=1121416 RepID=A0A1M7YB01_9BACT|nr:hydroxyethylthiazole kinase [Desulfopila aestuarii]SHO49797.1 hydroxyethylthiazole kinase [Desulfopila aestuarii DSM 18488]
MSSFGQICAENLEKVRARKPLIHNITNFVVMNSTANVLLAAGASPVMAHAANEVEEMAGFAGALVLNIGTLTDIWVESMLLAGRKCTELKTPIVLDPVGSGATALRTITAKRIIEETSVSVIRGNASEILSLRNTDSKTKGVDSLHSVDEAAEAAKALAIELGTTLAITGPVDLVTDGQRVLRVANGHPLMSYVTGTGCAATSVIGAFAAVDDDTVTATATALAYYGLAGEKAGAMSNGPGSFMVNLLDALYNLTPEDVKAGSKISADA